MSAEQTWWTLAACIAAVYACRAGGVLLSARIARDSALFHWAACVSYAMIATLVARLVLMPHGVVAQTVLADRVIACVVATVLYFGGRRNLLVGVLVGVATLAVLHHLRFTGL